MKTKKEVDAVKKKFSKALKGNGSRAGAMFLEATQRAVIAEHELTVDNERFNTLEMQLEAARVERDVARADLKGWLTTHPPSICSAHQVLDLACYRCNPALHERDVAQLSCATLRDVLTRISLTSDEDRKLVDNAVSGTPDRGWISPGEHKTRMDALQKQLIAVCVQHA